jgi:benzoate 4-monooxygenase
VNEFVPERWYPGNLTETQKKAFMAWGIGPRQCTGRNVAEMEVMLIIATVVRRYEFVLYDEVLVTSEGFLNKPVKCEIGIRKRVD